jgi:alkanesulfonate monooxygenase SsuD/methylene tetrahydromethanopterin reductase-like flavin-dependent oxidoreductase (luciferase family)
MSGVKLGLLCWNQNSDWPSLLEAGVRADRLGYDTLWAWDHLYPIVGDPHGPFYEGWLTITAWAVATSRVRVGLMVGANPYRNPALVAKMATTLDHISGGRTYLGIGAAWNEAEARDFGMEFGSGMPDRLRWLAEALPIIRGMLRGEAPTAAGPHYNAVHVRNDPTPLQTHLPILIGGGGERVTLKLVAQFADANNVGDGFETVKRKEEILRRHCETVGRDEREIERTAGVGVVVIRDSHAEAERVFRRLFEVNRIAARWQDQPVGTPEEVAEKLAPYLGIGYRHLIVGHPAPFDEESAVRLAQEVRPILEKAG